MQKPLQITYRDIVIDVVVPGGEVVAGRDAPEPDDHQDLYAAIDAAFDVARRRLDDRARRHRRVAMHETTRRDSR